LAECEPLQISLGDYLYLLDGILFDKHSQTMRS